VGQHRAGAKSAVYSPNPNLNPNLQLTGTHGDTATHVGTTAVQLTVGQHRLGAKSAVYSPTPNLNPNLQLTGTQGDTATHVGTSAHVPGNSPWGSTEREQNLLSTALILTLTLTCN